MKGKVLAGCVLALLAGSVAVRMAVSSEGDAVYRQDAGQPYMRQLAALRAGDDVLPPRLQRVELFAMFNREAPVPPQCYTRTEGKHNPCYVCHQDGMAGRENVMNDHKLQAEYAFSDVGLENHWRNLFVDRSARAAQISDEEILRWIDADNYSELAGRLREAGYRGWIPDLANLQEGAAAFDAQGFALDGSDWVAFNYKPMPSTFWPTNGATDDVMIRLPPEFRRDAGGQPSRAVYRENLQLLEANIKGRETARKTYAGGASGIALVPYIYPQGTEFLHSVRYVGIGKDGSITNSRRMKELRYMRRWIDSTPQQLQMWYEAENAEKEKGELPSYVNFGHAGLGGPMGWQLAGFIEGPNGRLRLNTFEENMFCMGCHNSIGTTIDKTFSFARKVDGEKGWGYLNLRGMPDVPNVGEKRGEIATYLERAGGGSEFRNNPEMQARWYRKDGSLNAKAIARARDVYELITPSVERALLLNKTYRVIVSEQSYLFGRDPAPVPPENVYQLIDAESAPTLPPERQFTWDIRLDWSAAK